MSVGDKVAIGDGFWDEQRFLDGGQPNGKITDIVADDEYVIVYFHDNSVRHYDFEALEAARRYVGKAGITWQIFAGRE